MGQRKLGVCIYRAYFAPKCTHYKTKGVLQNDSRELYDFFANRIKLLKGKGLVKGEIDTLYPLLRKTRNDAVHAGLDSLKHAKTLLGMAYKYR